MRLKHFLRPTVALWLLGVCAGEARAQDAGIVSGDPAQAAGAEKPLPSGGALLVGKDSLGLLKLSGKAADQAEVAVVDVAGQPFKKALRITIKAKTGLNDVLLTAPTVAEIWETDALFIRFWARTVESGRPGGDATFRFFLHKAGDLGRPGRIDFSRDFTAGRNWTRLDSPQSSLATVASGKGEFAFQLGGEPRTVEIGGLHVLNYGKRRYAHQLPHPPGPTYEGREANAPWRTEAAARIEQHRKGDLTVRVTTTGAGGRPVAGAQVAVKMTRHAYEFGTCVRENFFARSEGKPDGDKYREALRKHFNHAVLEGGHKWRTWGAAHNENRDHAFQTVNWLRENNLTVRGHLLVWPMWRNLPPKFKPEFDRIQAAEGPEAAKAYLRKIIHDHIHEMAGAFKGQLSDWDVINETHTNHEFMDLLGEPEMAVWFKTAAEVVPGLPLYFTDYDVIKGPHLETFERHVKLLLDLGAPISGLGEQGHTAPMPMAHVFRNLDRMARFGLPIKITEFDIVTPDDQLQADWTRDFLTAVFSHPASVGFLMWGFWDGTHWLGDAGMFYPDWSLKPSGQVWIDLTQKQWWTDAAGEADAAGEYRVRGFLGDYEVRVSHAGKTKTVKATLGKEGATLAVALE